MPAIADVNSAAVQMSFVPVLEQTAQVSELTFSQLLGALAISEEGVQPGVQAVGAKANKKNVEPAEIDTDSIEKERDEEISAAQISLIVMGTEIVAPAPSPNQGDASNRNISQTIETETAVTPPADVDWRKPPQRIATHEQEVEKEVTRTTELPGLSTLSSELSHLTDIASTHPDSAQKSPAESDLQPLRERAKAIDQVQKTGVDPVVFKQTQTLRAANAITSESGSNAVKNIEQTTSHTRVVPTKQSSTAAEVQVESSPNKTAIRIPAHSVNGAALDVREKEPGEKIAASSSSSVAGVEHIPSNAKAIDSSRLTSDRPSQQSSDPPQPIELEPAPTPRIAFHVERLAERFTGSELYFDWRMKDSSAMQVSTVVRDQVVALGITTESKETATALRTELPTLSAHLNEQSFRLGDVDIRTHEAAMTGMSSDSGHHGEREWRTQTLPFIGAGDSITRQEEVEVWKLSEGNTSVSLLA